MNKQISKMDRRRVLETCSFGAFFSDRRNKDSMYKRKNSQLHVAHPNPKRPRFHWWNDMVTADIAIAIMVGIFAILPYTYTDVDIYDGITPYIHDLTLELKYDDMPVDELTTCNFIQAATNIILETTRMDTGGDIFGLVARHAIRTIRTGRDTVRQRRRCGSLAVPYTFPVDDNVIAVLQLYD